MKSETLENSTHNASTIRTLGGLLMIIGFLLVGSMSAIMLWMNKAINNPSSTVKYNGTADKKMVTFLILGAVAAFGCSAFLAGSFQLATGKRSRMLIWLMLGLWVVLMIMAYVVQVVF